MGFLSLLQRQLLAVLQLQLLLVPLLLGTVSTAAAGSTVFMSIELMIDF